MNYEVNAVYNLLQKLNTEQQEYLKDLLVDKGIDISFNRRIFLKNTLDVDVDGITRKNTYTVKSMFDVVEEGSNVAEIKHVTLDKITSDWEDIELYGNNLVDEIKEEYNITD